jgi:hypothetical protein
MAPKSSVTIYAFIHGLEPLPTQAVPLEVVVPQKIQAFNIAAPGGGGGGGEEVKVPIVKVVNGIGRRGLIQCGWPLEKVLGIEGNPLNTSGVVLSKIIPALWSEYGGNDPEPVNFKIAESYASTFCRAKHFPLGPSIFQVDKTDYDSFSQCEERTSPTNYLRRYDYEKLYAIENDAYKAYMGIWVVGAHNLSPTLTEILMEPATAASNASASSIATGVPYEYDLSKASLLHPEYFTHLSSRIQHVLGIELRPLPTIDGPREQISFYLSDLTSIFSQLGVDEVNIVEDSCRAVLADPGISPIEGSALLRSSSTEEKAKYFENGGKKNITKKKRSKKSKKKSKKSKKSKKRTIKKRV